MALMNSSTGRPAVQASSGLMNSTTGRPAVPAFNQGSDPEMSFSGQIQQGADVFGTLNSIREANNAFNAEQADKQMAYQTQSQEKAMNFNAKEAQKNRDWQEYMSNTAHQREVQDLLAAGVQKQNRD